MKKQIIEILQKLLQELEAQNEEEDDEEECNAEEEEEEFEEEDSFAEETGEESAQVKKRGWESDVDWYYAPESNEVKVSEIEQKFAEKMVAFCKARRELVKAREKLQEVYDIAGYSFNVAKAVVDANAEEEY